VRVQWCGVTIWLRFASSRVSDCWRGSAVRNASSRVAALELSGVINFNTMRDSVVDTRTFSKSPGESGMRV